MIFRPAIEPQRPRADTERARQLVLRWGWNATAYQILNPGIAWWFGLNGAAVVGYVVQSGVRVVAGAPICDPNRLPQAVREFERDALQCKQRVTYFGAAERLHALLQDDSNYCTVVMGAQPVWNPRGWNQIIAQTSSLRAQISRARNKGLTVEEWPPEPATATQLRPMLHLWLKTRHLPPLKFLSHPQILDDLGDRRVFVARLGAENVGYAIASPVPARCGWLLEQVVRAPQAPNGVAELLIDAAVRRCALEDCAYFTLGLVPLSRHVALRSEGTCNPVWLRVFLNWARAHGRRFYNFGGLEAFKSKFRPHDWEPIYALSREPSFSPSTLYAITAAFSDVPPARALSGALWHALHQELVWKAARAATASTRT